MPASAQFGRATFNVEISPLLEEQWTGIPVVAANMARQVLRFFPDRTTFFFGAAQIDQNLVLDALARNSGRYLARGVTDGWANTGVVQTGGRGPVRVGLFPSVKRVGGLFDVECSIVHDLSTLIVPQYHALDTVEYHMSALYDDVLSNTVTGCVSQATLDDVHAYFGVPQSRLFLAPNGFEWQAQDLAAATNDVEGVQIEPYFLVIGTREPRKNIMRIVDALVQSPDLTRSHTFVFAGRMGWLSEQQTLPDEIRDAMDRGRIVFPGYVSEAQKCKLLMGAEASIYPSCFEGFGLPVLESLSLGTPCIASWSSSLPEVGADACIYFDPFSTTDFHRALTWVIANRPKSQPAVRAACQEQARQFSWEGFMDKLLAALAPHIAAMD